MTYRAVLNLDYSKTEPNSYQKLLTALIQLGWEYRETSALTLDTSDLNTIWVSLEVIAKQSEAAGTLSAMTMQVQLLGPSKPYKAAKKHTKALAQIQARPFPKLP